MDNVLVIRAKEEGERTLLALRDKDFKADLISLSTISFNKINIDLDAFDNVIISSRNTIKSLSASDKKKLNSKKIFAVTQNLDFENVEYFDNMQILLQHLLRFNINERLLYLKGNYSSLTNSEMAELSNLGCDFYECYNVQYNDHNFALIKDNLINNKYLAILFFSRKSSDHFLKLVQNANIEHCLLNIKLCCISARVALTFQALKAENILIAEQPNLASIIKCLDYQ